MTFDDLVQVAEGAGVVEEVLGQLWIERDHILKRVNSVPPQCRAARARSELLALRDRVDREGNGRSDDGRFRLVPRVDKLPAERIRRKW